jgi:hypothetical protein
MATLVDVSTSDDLLSLEEILASNDIETRDVEVPGWGRNGKPGLVRIRMLTNSELMTYGEKIEGKGQKMANLTLVMMSCVTKDGKPLFDDQSVRKMMDKSAKSINTIAKEILDLNGVKPGTAERAKND